MRAASKNESRDFLIGRCQMPETVKCRICGRVYNSRYVSTHMRRTHPEIARAADPARFEQKIVEKIVNLFNQLSPETRKQVLRTMGLKDCSL